MKPNLDELDAAHAAATRGEWRAREDHTRHRGIVEDDHAEVLVTYCGAVDGHGAANAHAIALLHNAYTEMSRRMRALERVAAAARTVALGMVEKDQYGKESPICLGCRYPVDVCDQHRRIDRCAKHQDLREALAALDGDA